jgi:hypothetical protein
MPVFLFSKIKKPFSIREESTNIFKHLFLSFSTTAAEISTFPKGVAGLHRVRSLHHS